MGKMLLMSKKEVDRLSIIRDVGDKRMTQKEAGRQLNLSSRQVRRVLKRYKKEGAEGLISHKRGVTSNNKITESRKEKILSLIKEQYSDFGPTLATEKLDERHDIRISKETVRRWMISEDIWKAKSRKGKAYHPLRERRARFGELIQIDGSPHDWFEGRRPKCNLTVFIDDATGEYMELFFSESETREAYVQTTLMHFEEYGRPRAFYSDKHSIFKVNKPDPKNGATLTQLGRAMKTLDIEIITANTPQAKGRVERANETLQDRLVKELRIEEIDTIEAANEFLKTYKEKLSNKFAVNARSSENAHRKVLHSKEELDLIFSKHDTRVISKDLEVQYNNTIYHLQVEGLGLTMRKSKITVCEDSTGKVTLIYKGKSMKYKVYKRAKKQLVPQDAKTLNKEVDKVIAEQNEREEYKYPVDAFSTGYEIVEVEVINEV